MKKLINAIFKNPKTTIAGVLGLVLTTAMQMGKIDAATFEVLLGVCASLGFVVSKDHSTTGV